VDFNGHPIPRLELVHVWTKFYDRPHLFMSGGEILVERFSAIDDCRQPMADDFQVCGANSNGVYSYKHFSSAGLRDRLFGENHLIRVSENPGFHFFR